MKLHNIGKKFNDNIILNSISFDIEKGEILGLFLFQMIIL